MPSIHKKIIIFDMDGVLFDSIGLARESFMERHPGITEEMYNELHSGNYHEEAQKFEHLKVQTSEEEEQIYHEEYSQKKSETGMFEGMNELLNELHSRMCILVLNTNAYEKNCLPLLEKVGIKNIFDFIAHADVSKDKVEKFKLIKERFGSQKEDFLFVTDALGDVKDAEKAAIQTIAVTFGVHNKSYFEREKHPYLLQIVDSPKQLAESLIAWLNK